MLSDCQKVQIQFVEVASDEAGGGGSETVSVMIDFFPVETSASKADPVSLYWKQNFWKLPLVVMTHHRSYVLET